VSASLQTGGLAHAVVPPRPVHLAIGIFDGVHLGHRAVIEAAVQSARRSGGVAAVLTFAPHPSVLFRPENPTPLIMETETKAALLRDLGVELVIVEPFTAAYAAIEAGDFVPELRRYLPRLATVYVGENWRFGRGRKGDVALLIAEGRKAGIGVFSAPRVNLDGEPISSTRIRALLTSGEIGAANTLLGRTYGAAGAVKPGKRLGRTLGFPTLNLDWAPGLRPRYGVYTVRVFGALAPEARPGVANYGLRPTVEEACEPRLETHVLGPCPYAEGDVIRVEWLSFLRPEQKFGSRAELEAQIGHDVAAARAEFSLP